MLMWFLILVFVAESGNYFSNLNNLNDYTTNNDFTEALNETRLKYIQLLHSHTLQAIFFDNIQPNQNFVSQPQMCSVQVSTGKHPFLQSQHIHFHRHA